MKQTYTTSTGFKIFYSLLTLILLSITLFITIFSGKNIDFTPGLSIVIVLEIGSALLVFINLYKRKIVISDNGISYITVWSSKEILLENVKGYKRTRNGIIVYPVSKNYSKLRIYDAMSISNYATFMMWLKEKFNDLDAVAIEQDKQQIFNRLDLGVTKEEREQKLENAIIYSIAYNTLGAILFIALTMLRVDNIYLTAFAILFPLMGMGLIIYSKGLIRMFARLDNSAYRSIYLGTLLTEVCLIVKAANDTTLYNYNNLWWPVLLVSSITFIAFLTITIKWVRNAILIQLFFIAFFSVGYGFGSILQINYAFDNSKKQVFPATVIDHYTSEGKSTSYNIVLNKWGNDTKNESISVSNLFYDDTPIGDTVKVHLNQGLLHIPWFTVSKN